MRWLALVLLLGCATARPPPPPPRAQVVGEVGETGLHLYVRMLTRACWGSEDEELIERATTAMGLCTSAGGDHCEARVCALMRDPEPDKFCRPLTARH